MSNSRVPFGAVQAPALRDHAEDHPGPTQALLSAGYEGLHLPAAVLLDNVRSMYNVGAFFRAADGVGLEKLCLCGITAHPPKKAITKTALGAEETVPWEHDWDALHMAETMRSRGFELAAIETSPTSVDLFDWQPKFPVCVAFGNEVEGLSPRAACRNQNGRHSSRQVESPPDPVKPRIGPQGIQSPVVIQFCRRDGPFLDRFLKPPKRQILFPQRCIYKDKRIRRHLCLAAVRY